MSIAFALAVLIGLMWRVFDQLSSLFPDLSRKMYEDEAFEAFGCFLDFVLDSPVRYPNASRMDWLPLGFDLYTTRIISMIVPVEKRVAFLEGLGSEFSILSR